MLNQATDAPSDKSEICVHWIFMWIKILCIAYIVWRILTTKSMFDVANMLKRIAVKYVQINKYELLNIQAC